MSQNVNFGMVGLGRMGANIVRRLSRHGITSAVYDLSADAVKSLAAEGAIATSGMADMAAKLTAPRTIWIMVPAGVTDSTIAAMAEHLEKGDTIIDGGNSYYKNDLKNAALLAEKGLHFVDVGTSGGVYGLERGYSLMIGGDKTVVTSLDPIFKALCPGVESAERTPGRTGEPAQAEYGYLHCGPVGSGHFCLLYTSPSPRD